jgi:phage tail-like protein
METLEALATCRFYVEIGGLAHAVFTEVSGLQLEVETFDYQEGGNNTFVYRLPGRMKVSNITFKRGWTGSPDFQRWCADIAEGRIVRKNISVIMYDAAGNEVSRWSLDNAYPVKWVAPQFKASEAAAAVETLELAYERFSMTSTESGPHPQRYTP